MKKSAFTKKIENQLAQKAPKKVTSHFSPEDYIMGAGQKSANLKFLNISIPQVRDTLINLKNTKKESYSSELFADMQKLWFESDYFEAKVVALCWLEQQNPEFLKKEVKSLVKWSLIINNWAHSDGYCSTMAKLFDYDQAALLPTYLKWNQHQNPWLRRCSMVGTFYYSRCRHNQPSFSLAKKLVAPHFKAPEYYVQKAVGWTIREMYNVYPAETIQFIDNNLYQITPVAWVAASEKLPEKIKTKLLVKRKKIRQK